MPPISTALLTLLLGNAIAQEAPTDDASQADAEAPDSEADAEAPDSEADAEAPTVSAAAEGTEQAQEADDTDDRVMVEIKLVNGSLLHGKTVMPSGDWTTLQLELTDGIVMDVSQASVESIRALPEASKGSAFAVPNPGNHRYMYSPSAIPMPKGTGYIAQKELIFTSAAYAVTDNISVLAGTIVPATLYAVVNGEVEAILGVAGARYGRQVNDRFAVGGGAEIFWVGPEASLLLPFVNATYGTPDTHASLALGTAIQGLSYRSAHMAVLAGTHRISHRVALISENWMLLTPDWDDTVFYDASTDTTEVFVEPIWAHPSMNVVINSMGVRLISERFTTDLALINAFVEGTYLPLPWVDFAWHF